MTESAIQPLDLLEHEFPIPCGSLWHEEFGHGPAVWVVWQSVCCDKRPPLGFCCDACLQNILNYPGASRCRDCGHRVTPARRSVLRVEALR